MQRLETSGGFRRWLRLWAGLFASWLLGCLVVGLVWWMGWSRLAATEVAAIALASGAIGVTAMLPLASWPWRWLLGRGTGRSPGAADREDLRPFVAAVLGMAIRVVGTVALFLTGRYQMGAPHGEIAAMVLGWYVYLTVIEILWVVRGAHARPGVVSAAPWEP